MKIPTFSFKNEAGWMMMFSIAIPVLGIVLLVLAWFLRWVF